MQNANIARYGITPKLRNHWKQFHDLWAAFRETASAVLRNNGLVAIEWPIRCRYWQDNRVRRLLSSGEWHRANVAACMYGMRPQAVHAENDFIGKVYCIRTTCAPLAAALELRCDGSHRHVPIAGGETAATAFYPELLARKVHDALYSWSSDWRATTSSPTSSASSTSSPVGPSGSCGSCMALARCTAAAAVHLEGGVCALPCAVPKTMPPL